MPSPLVSLDGYVVASSRYQDTSALVTLFSQDGLHKLKIPSGYDVKSKNHQACLLLNRILVDSYQPGDGEILFASGVKTLENHTDLYEDLEKNAACSLALELITSFFPADVPPFASFEAFLKGIGDGFSTLTLVSIFTAKVIAALGSKPDIDGCVNCGSKKNLVSFSWDEGGYLCSRCAEEMGVPKTPLNELKIVRYLFLVDEARYEHAVLPEASCKKVLSDMVRFLEESFRTKVRGFELYEQILSRRSPR